MKGKIQRIIEFLWIITGAACIVAAVISYLRNDPRHMWMFLLMAVISFGFALIRYNQRKRG